MTAAGTQTEKFEMQRTGRIGADIDIIANLVRNKFEFHNYEYYTLLRKEITTTKEKRYLVYQGYFTKVDTSKQ
jgi:hypothetical protein